MSNTKIPVTLYDYLRDKNSSIESTHHLERTPHEISTRKNQMRTKYPEEERWKVETVYPNNTFDLNSLDDTKQLRKVDAADPNAKKYYQQGDLVVVRFKDCDKQKPYIKFGIGFNIPKVKDLTVSPAYQASLWPQAEGNPFLSQTSLSQNFFFNDFSITLAKFGTGDAPTGVPPNVSYTHNGCWFWEDTSEYSGQYGFLGWTQVGFSWYLTAVFAPVFDTLTTGGSAQRKKVLLDPYTIVDHGGLLAQGGSTWAGGKDPGVLSSCYNKKQNAFFTFGPLTDQDGRLKFYYLDRTKETKTTSLVTKLPIHTSIGNLDVLIGWWGVHSDESPSYYLDSNIRLYSISSGLRQIQLDKTLSIPELAKGNYIYSCHPNVIDNDRARGRWPWRLYNQGDGDFAIAVRSADYGVVTTGGQTDPGLLSGGFPNEHLIVSPDPVEQTSYLQKQYLQLLLVNRRDGLKTTLQTTQITVNETSINTDSFNFFEFYIPYNPPTFDHIMDQKGWAETDGEARKRVSVPVSAQFPDGVRIVHYPIYSAITAPIYTHPLPERNTLTRVPIGSDFNAVFEWAPTVREQTPAGVFSSSGHYCIVFSVPNKEIYGGNNFSEFYHYTNPEYPPYFHAYSQYQIDHNAWYDGGEVGPEPQPPPPSENPGPDGHSPYSFIQEVYRMPNVRTYYTTFLLHLNEKNEQVALKDISQYMYGLRDYINDLDASGNREYDVRPIFDQVWQYALLDTNPKTGDHPSRYCIGMIADFRDYDEPEGYTPGVNGPSEARPEFFLFSYDNSATAVFHTPLAPIDRYSTGEFDDAHAIYEKYMYAGKPIFKWGVNPDGYTMIDIYSQYRTRTTPDVGDIGDINTHVLRITQLRWDADHLDLANPVMTYIEITIADGGFLDEQQLDNIAYISGFNSTYPDHPGYAIFQQSNDIKYFDYA